MKNNINSKSQEFEKEIKSFKIVKYCKIISKYRFDVKYNFFIQKEKKII
jgi:hypothetical protein